MLTKCWSSAGQSLIHHKHATYSHVCQPFCEIYFATSPDPPHAFPPFPECRITNAECRDHAAASTTSTPTKICTYDRVCAPISCTCATSRLHRKSQSEKMRTVARHESPGLSASASGGEVHVKLETATPSHPPDDPASRPSVKIRTIHQRSCKSWPGTHPKCAPSQDPAEETDLNTLSSLVDEATKRRESDGSPSPPIPVRQPLARFGQPKRGDHPTHAEIRSWPVLKNEPRPRKRPRYLFPSTAFRPMPLPKNRNGRTRLACVPAAPSRAWGIYPPRRTRRGHLGWYIR